MVSIEQMNNTGDDQKSKADRLNANRKPASLAFFDRTRHLHQNLVDRFESIEAKRGSTGSCDSTGV